MKLIKILCNAAKIVKPMQILCQDIAVLNELNSHVTILLDFLKNNQQIFNKTVQLLVKYVFLSKNVLIVRLMQIHSQGITVLDEFYSHVMVPMDLLKKYKQSLNRTVHQRVMNVAVHKMRHTLTLFMVIVVIIGVILLNVMRLPV